MKKIQKQELSLVIGDKHNAPGQKHDSTEALNQFIRETKPTRIVIIGDWVDMASLSRFDTLGSKALEGTRIMADMKSGLDDLEILLDKVPEEIPLIYVEGNHENRITRMEEEHPRLEGLSSYRERVEDVANEREFLWIPYRDYWTHWSGLMFTHIPHNNMQPIASTQGVRKALSLSATSVIYGHTHQLDFATLTRNGGQQIHGLNVGCFIDPRYDPEYMKGKIKDWWRGVALLHHFPNRPWDGEFTTVSLETLLRRKKK